MKKAIALLPLLLAACASPPAVGTFNPHRLPSLPAVATPAPQEEILAEQNLSTANLKEKVNLP